MHALICHTHNSTVFCFLNMSSLPGFWRSFPPSRSQMAWDAHPQPQWQVKVYGDPPCTKHMTILPCFFLIHLNYRNYEQDSPAELFQGSVEYRYYIFSYLFHSFLQMLYRLGKSPKIFLCWDVPKSMKRIYFHLWESSMIWGILMLRYVKEPARTWLHPCQAAESLRWLLRSGVGR